MVDGRGRGRSLRKQVEREEKGQQQEQDQKSDSGFPHRFLWWGSLEEMVKLSKKFNNAGRESQRFRTRSASAPQPLHLPDLEVADGARDAFKYRNNEALNPVLPCAVVDVVLVEHGRERQQNTKRIRAEPALKILLGLYRGVVIQFVQNALDPEVLDMDDGLLNRARLVWALDPFVYLSHKPEALLVEKPDVVGGIPDAMVNGFFQKEFLAADFVLSGSELRARKQFLQALFELGRAGLISVKKQDPWMPRVFDRKISLCREPKPLFLHESDLRGPGHGGIAADLWGFILAERVNDQDLIAPGERAQGTFNVGGFVFHDEEGADGSHGPTLPQFSANFL